MLKKNGGIPAITNAVRNLNTDGQKVKDTINKTIETISDTKLEDAPVENIEAGSKVVETFEDMTVDTMYVSYLPHDNAEYAATWGKNRSAKNNPAKIVEYVADRDLKIASNKQAADILFDEMQKDSKFRDYMLNLNKDNTELKDLLSRTPTTQEKIDFYNGMNYNWGQVQGVYTHHNRDMSKMNTQRKESLAGMQRIFDRLQKAGYSGVEDMMDAGKDAERPLILFKQSSDKRPSVTAKSFRYLTPDDWKDSEKYQKIRNARSFFENYEGKPDAPEWQSKLQYEPITIKAGTKIQRIQQELPAMNMINRASNMDYGGMADKIEAGRQFFEKWLE